METSPEITLPDCPFDAGPAADPSQDQSSDEESEYDFEGFESEINFFENDFEGFETAIAESNDFEGFESGISPKDLPLLQILREEEAEVKSRSQEPKPRAAKPRNVRFIRPVRRTGDIFGIRPTSCPGNGYQRLAHKHVTY